MQSMQLERGGKLKDANTKTAGDKRRAARSETRVRAKMRHYAKNERYARDRTERKRKERREGEANEKVECFT